jgi:hypothetical protein
MIVKLFLIGIGALLFGTAFLIWERKIRNTLRWKRLADFNAIGTFIVCLYGGLLTIARSFPNCYFLHNPTMHKYLHLLHLVN